MLEYLSDDQLTPLFPAIALLVASVILFHFWEKRVAMVLLFSGTLILGAFVAHLDPFLRIWDEQYHALVAKNMMDNPFVPMLIKDQYHSFNYQDWMTNQVWVFKQPLFLWQIAFSLKLFGTTAFAVRIPSILMHAIGTLLIYRIGKLTINETMGFYSAFFFAVSRFLLEQSAGAIATDHCDQAVLFYILASFWSWIEFIRMNQIKWLVLTGILVGMAVLSKWLLGLLLYPCWLLAILASKEDRKVRLNYVVLFMSGIITLAVFVPWQIYILNSFPDETRFAYAFNGPMHIFSNVGPHSNDLLFHFKAIKQQYGSGALVPLILLGGLVALWFRTKNIQYKVALVAAVVMIYGLFTVASTKMQGYTMIISPIIFMGMGSVTDLLFEFLKKKAERFKTLLKVIAALLIITIGFFLLNINKIQDNHSYSHHELKDVRDIRMKGVAHIEQIPDSLLTGDYVFYNAGVINYVELMFRKGITAYPNMIIEEQYKEVKSAGKKVALFFDRKGKPEWLTNDPDLVIYLPGEYVPEFGY